MDGAIEWLGSIPLATWGPFALGAILGAGIICYAHARRAFYQWRLDGRLARDPYILREELAEHRLRLGEALEPIDYRKVIAESLFECLLLGVSAALAVEHLDAWHTVLLAIFVITLLVAWWRWLNDPDAKPFTLSTEHVPREAVIGFAGAIGIVALIVLAAILFF